MVRIPIEVPLMSLPRRNILIISSVPGQSMACAALWEPIVSWCRRTDVVRRVLSDSPAPRAARFLPPVPCSTVFGMFGVEGNLPAQRVCHHQPNALDRSSCSHTVMVHVIRPEL